MATEESTRAPKTSAKPNKVDPSAWLPSAQTARPLQETAARPAGVPGWTQPTQGATSALLQLVAPQHSVPDFAPSTPFMLMEAPSQYITPDDLAPKAPSFALTQEPQQVQLVQQPLDSGPPSVRDARPFEQVVQPHQGGVPGWEPGPRAEQHIANLVARAQAQRDPFGAVGGTAPKAVSHALGYPSEEWLAANGLRPSAAPVDGPPGMPAAQIARPFQEALPRGEAPFGWVQPVAPAAGAADVAPKAVSHALGYPSEEWAAANLNPAAPAPGKPSAQIARPFQEATPRGDAAPGFSLPMTPDQAGYGPHQDTAVPSSSKGRRASVQDGVALPSKDLWNVRTPEQVAQALGLPAGAEDPSDVGQAGAPPDAVQDLIDQGYDPDVAAVVAGSAYAQSRSSRGANDAAGDPARVQSVRTVEDAGKLVELSKKYNELQGKYDSTWKGGTKRVKLNPLDLENLNDAQRTALDLNTVLTRAMRADRRWRKSGGEMSPAQEKLYYETMAKVRGIDPGLADTTIYEDGEQAKMSSNLLQMLVPATMAIPDEVFSENGNLDVLAQQYGPGGAKKLSPNVVNALNELGIESAGDIDNYRTGKALFSMAELRSLGKTDELQTSDRKGRTADQEIVDAKNDALSRTGAKLKELLQGGDLMLKDSSESLGYGIGSSATELGGSADALLARGNQKVEPAILQSWMDNYGKALDMGLDQKSYIDMMRGAMASSQQRGMDPMTLFNFLDAQIDQQLRGAADGVTNSPLGMKMDPKKQRQFFDLGMKELGYR